MKPFLRQAGAFTFVEVLVGLVVIAILAGIGVAGISGMRESARRARLQNDVAVLNNGIDAYLAAGGVIPANATAQQVIDKLKTVASTNSTTLGPAGPFIDPRLQLVMQSEGEAAAASSRADYPNAAGYFYIREAGGPGIREFASGAASPVVYETRQGSMPYTAQGEYVAAYQDTAVTAPSAASAPSLIAGEDDFARTGRDLAKLPRPTLRVRLGGTSTFVDYSGWSISALNYPLEVELSSPLNISGSSRFTYTLTNKGGQVISSSGDSPSPVVITNIDWSSGVIARVVSTDTNRYADSDPVKASFAVIPVSIKPVFPVGQIPSSVDYATAGGEMFGKTVSPVSNAVVKLENIDSLAPKYRSSTYLQAFYKTTNFQRYSGAVSVSTNSGFSAPTFTPVTNTINVAWFGANSKIKVVASVESYDSEFIVAGEKYEQETEIKPTELTVGVIPLKPIGLPPTVTVTLSGDYPSGVRRFYTLSGVAPLNPETGGTNIPSAVLTTNGLVTGTPIATYTVSAQATGPSGTEHWFTCTRVNRTYIAITTVPLSYVGLNMYQANINGYVKGSIYMQAGDFAVLNAGARIEGNVYVPGLPRVTLPGGSGGTVVNYSRSYDQATDAAISTNRIAGREYTTEGVLADPQSDLRKVVDLYGATTSTPAQYEVKINNTASIDGKLFRRSDPPPVSSVKPGLPPDIVLSNGAVNVTGSRTLAAGSYAVTMTNTNAVLRLGSPGTLTSYVFGVGSAWSAGRVEILGPVQIYLNSATSFNGVTFGGSNSIYQTGFVVMSNYSVSIDNNASVFGQFEARDSEISIGSGGGSTIKGTLVGSAFAKRISVDGSGYVDVSGGSGTNSATNIVIP